MPTLTPKSIGVPRGSEVLIADTLTYPRVTRVSQCNAGSPKALHSLEEQVREALHRAQALQQQLSAIQANQQAPPSTPQQRQAPSTDTAKQDLQHPLQALHAQWQTPCSSPRAESLDACMQARGAQLMQGAVSTPQQAPGSGYIEVLHPAHTPDHDDRAQTQSGSLKRAEHALHTGISIQPPAQSGQERSLGGQQLYDMRGPEANSSHTRGCFWRRVCPGIDVRESRSSAHAT